MSIITCELRKKNPKTKDQTNQKNANQYTIENVRQKKAGKKKTIEAKNQIIKKINIKLRTE